MNFGIGIPVCPTRVKHCKGVWGVAVLQPIHHSLVSSICRRSCPSRLTVYFLTCSSWKIVWSWLMLNVSVVLYHCGVMTKHPKAIFLGSAIINNRYQSNLGRFTVQSFKGNKAQCFCFPSLLFAARWIAPCLQEFIFCLVVFSRLYHLGNCMDILVKCQCIIKYCWFIILACKSDIQLWAGKTALFSHFTHKIAMYVLYALDCNMKAHVKFSYNTCEFQPDFQTISFSILVKKAEISCLKGQNGNWAGYCLQSFRLSFIQMLHVIQMLWEALAADAILHCI